jgi:putative ABC transport system substrate-binding protein
MQKKMQEVGPPARYNPFPCALGRDRLSVDQIGGRPMRRREFIAGLGSAGAWPVVARAQQGERVRRIGLLDAAIIGNNFSQIFIATLREGLAKLGWVEGRNLRIDLRYSAGNIERMRNLAAELVSLEPEVVVANSGATIRALQQATRTIPIVFAGGGDVALNGIVKNIAQPEGNTTGIANLFYSIGSKWLELLKDAVPSLERVAIISDPRLNAESGYPAAIEAAAPHLRVHTTRITSYDAQLVRAAIDGFAAEPNGGLIIVQVAPGPEVRKLINQLAVQYRLPAIYGDAFFAEEGGLLSYGSDVIDLNRRVPFYVDRLLRGAKVSELPVEYPTKFELVVNMKTAKAIGATIPEPFLLRAEKVIE